MKAKPSQAVNTRAASEARLPPEIQKGAREIARRLAPLLKALEAY